MSARNNGPPHRPPDDFEVAQAKAEWGQAIQDLIELRKALREPGAEDLQERARAAEERLRNATTRLSRLKQDDDVAS